MMVIPYFYTEYIDDDVSVFPSEDINDDDFSIPILKIWMMMILVFSY